MTRSFKPFYHQPYLDKGKGHPVVILHGPFGNLRMWRSVVAGLKDQFRVVIPRLPLFGLPAKSTSINELTEILFEFLDWHQLTDVTLIGHGLGAQIALRHAHDHPDITKNVVVSGMHNSVINDLQGNGMSDHDYDTVTNAIKSAFYDESKVTHVLVDAVFETLHNSSSMFTISKLFEDSEANSVNPLLSGISQPVLLAWGLHDRITPPEIAIHLHDHLPNAEVRFISQSGHLPMVEEAEQFVGAIMDFLSQHH